MNRQATVTMQDLRPDGDIIIDPGQTALLSFTLINRGAEVDSFLISPIGVPSLWLERDPPAADEIRLRPGQQQRVNIALTPPPSPDSRAGLYQLRIQAFSRRMPDLVAAQEKKVTVTPFHSFSCSLRPIKEDGVHSGLYRIELKNDGNTDIRLDLRAWQETKSCEFELSAHRVTVPAGQIRHIELKVWTKGQLSTASPIEHPFTITALSRSTQASQHVEGIWKQTAPRYTMKLSPKKKETVSKGHFKVIIDNQSEVDLPLTLKAEDAEHSCRYGFGEEKLIVPPDARDYAVNLRVRPATYLRRRDPKQHQFTVTGQLIGTSDVVASVEGEWVELPSAFTRFPLGRLLALILLALVVSVLGLYLLLKPSPLVIKHVEAKNIYVTVEPGGDTKQVIEIAGWAEAAQAGMVQKEIVRQLRRRLPKIPGNAESGSILDLLARFVRHDADVRIVNSNNLEVVAWSTALPAIVKATLVINEDTIIDFSASNSIMAVSTSIPIKYEPPTATLTPTPTPMPTPTPTHTPAPCLPSVRINQPLPVFLGPSSDYGLLGELNSGDQTVRGRNPENTWWQIPYPDAPDGFAWISANPKYTSPICNTETVPVAQPPATVTPTPTVTPSPTATALPTPFYYFNVRAISAEPCGVRLIWEVRYVDQVYLTNIPDDQSLPRRPGRSDLIPVEGEPRKFLVLTPPPTCPTSSKSTQYVMHVFHKDQANSECLIEYEYVKDGDNFEVIEGIDTCHDQ